MTNIKPQSAGQFDETFSRYANILLDYWFKRSFGRDINKRLMILTLREIIPEADISDITYGNKEHPNPFPDSHGVVFDIECVSSSGSMFIVEVQLARKKWFMERALFYSSFAIQKQLLKGDDSYNLMPTYFIALMDFSLHDDESGRFAFRYELIDRESGELMTDRLHFIFLELPNVKRVSDKSSNLEKLCYALHNMTALKSRPKEMQAEIFELLFNSAEIAKFDPEEKTKYEYDMTTERDRRNELAYSREEGEAIGKAAGKAEERERIVRVLREKGFSEEEIDSIVNEKNT